MPVIVPVKAYPVEVGLYVLRGRGKQRRKNPQIGVGLNALGAKIASLITPTDGHSMMHGVPKLLRLGGEELRAIAVLLLRACGKHIGDSSQRISAQHQNACVRISDAQVSF